MKEKIYVLLTLCGLFVFSANAQVPQGKSVKPLLGQKGIKKSFSELNAFSQRSSLTKTTLDSSSVKPYRSIFKKYQNVNRPVRGNSTGIIIPHAGNVGNKSAASQSQVPVAGNRNNMGGSETQNIGSNFLSIDFYENPIGWPPDPSGAVGESQIIVATNNGIKIYDKPGINQPPLVTPTGYSGVRADDALFISLENFFSPVLPITSGISDPHIRYDRLSKRWYVVAIEVNPTQENNLILLAVSDGEKITNSSFFTFYSFNSSLFPYDPAAPYYPFLDFPTIGVDKNSVVIGGNQFGYDSLTNVGYVIDKKRLLNGQLVVYPFELGVASFIDGSIAGMYTPQAVHNDDPSGKKSFFAGISYFQDALLVATINYDNDRPYLTPEVTIPVEPFNNPRNNSHPGSLTPLDQNDTRLLQAAIHTNKITGARSLWTAHAIGVDQTGHFINGTDSDFVNVARTGSRWYEIGEIYTNPALSQAGTLTDEHQQSGRRAVQYFNPSIAESGQGHAVLSGTTDAYNEYLNVFAAGRYNSEPLGTLNDPVKATNTTAIYAPYIDFGGGFFYYISRWGDFSQTVVDPSDDQTIWTFQEYASTDDSYGVRVVELKAPPPAKPKALGSFSNNMDATVTISGVSDKNSGFFDPGDDKGGPGFNRLSVRSTGNVGVAKIKFINPTSISIKLETKNKPAGDYFLVITNPDGQVVVTTYSIEGSAQSSAANPLSQADIVARTYIVKSGISPNPNNGNFKLEVNAAKDFNGKILLLNSNGDVLSKNSYNFSRGSTAVPLSLSSASKGNYLAAVYNENNVLIAVHKIVKQ